METGLGRVSIYYELPIATVINLIFINRTFSFPIIFLNLFYLKLRL